MHQSSTLCITQCTFNLHDTEVIICIIVVLLKIVNHHLNILDNTQGHRKTQQQNNSQLENNV
jgi:hypothetical protein